LRKYRLGAEYQKGYALKMKSVLSESGHISLPKVIRDRLAMKPGTELEMEIVTGGLMVRKKPSRSPWKDVFGALGRAGESDKIVEDLRGKPDAVGR
jgi:bifunctional DNA-binding transcriptional regulator/antitoxin component of YhaV-PrlF toxin-antitoxin module